MQPYGGGIGCFALATQGSRWTLAGPLLMSFLIIRVSRVSLLEKGLGDSKPGYPDCVERTSAFFPRPPRG